MGKTLIPMLRDEYEITHFDVADPGDGLPFIQGDLRDLASVEKACAGKDAVLHIAALHGQAWNRAGDTAGFDVNVTGTKNILEGAVKQGVKRVIYTSSINAVGGVPPFPIDENSKNEALHLYGLTKTLGETMCAYYSARFGISTICLRPGGILNPRDSVAKYGFPTACWCVDPRDVAQAHKLALEAVLSVKHDVFNITSELLTDIEGYKKNPAAAFKKKYPDMVAALPADVDFAKLEWYSIEKAKRVLGYNPKYGLI